MKQQLLEFGRNLGLLGSLDRMHGLAHRIGSVEPNRRFQRAHPGYALPPADLAFEAYGHTRWDEYRRTGQAHAEIFAGLICSNQTGPRPRVLEWGCGCGRILRHLGAAGLGEASLWGVDVDPRAIQWCQKNLVGIEFRHTAPAPPLPFADASFDAVYHYSVWTHLSPARVSEWCAEFARILRPGGLMLGTTHGVRYGRMLLPPEHEHYRAGLPVVRGKYTEGRKYFLSFFPESFTRAMLTRWFSDVRLLPQSPAVPQDLWLAIK